MQGTQFRAVTNIGCTLLAPVILALDRLGTYIDTCSCFLFPNSDYVLRTRNKHSILLKQASTQTIIRANKLVVNRQKCGLRYENKSQNVNIVSKRHGIARLHRNLYFVHMAFKLILPPPSNPSPAPPHLYTHFYVSLEERRSELVSKTKLIAIERSYHMDK